MNALWLIPALPLAAFLAIVLGGRRWSRRAVSLLGTLGAAASSAMAIEAAFVFFAFPPDGGAYLSSHWTWVHVGGLDVQAGLYLDPLSLVMTLVVTGVSTMILVYSTRYMADDDDYGRFFAYMNLFVAMMLLVVLADNLLLLYVGWEGVGLCSYLLISFWYRDEANVRAGRKAFLVTRIGDAAFAVCILLLFTHLGTLDIQSLLQEALARWPVGSALATVAAALLLAGALGKSAQLPLQVWLPDAMAGPTPTSALIHAATMVTAGVYLLARMHVLLPLAPVVQQLVAIIGAVTLLLAAFSALAQRDIKRVLAYSTISQIGYMFLALGVGAAWAATYHFVTHALFKSLLFLAAGAVILAMRHEQDMFKMGGLRRAMPLVFWTFLIGAAALSALPLVTSGDYSKDYILEATWVSGSGGKVLWVAGLVGAALTAAYTFRAVFLVFYGPVRQQPKVTKALAVSAPLVVLAAGTVVAALLQWPRSFGGPLWSLREFLQGTFARYSTPFAEPPQATPGMEMTLLAFTGLASLVGLGAAYVCYLRWPAVAGALGRSRLGAGLTRLWLSGWGFDWLYDRLLVRPFVWLARLLKNDVVDVAYEALARALLLVHWTFALSVNGRLRWYAAGIVIGAIILLAVVVLR